MSRLFKDNDDKNSLLIKMAYNVSLEELEKEYQITKKQIINIRKNNYKTYNTFSEHFMILDEVAQLGLQPIFEYAVNICKKSYKDKFTIKSSSYFIFRDNQLNILQVVDLANSILERDELPPLCKSRIKINQYYTQKVKRCRKRKPKI